MVSAWSFLLAAAQIFLLLQFFAVQSFSFNRTLENSDGMPRIERASSRRFLYRKNPFFINKNIPNTNPNNDTSFRRVSTRRIRSDTVSKSRRTVTVRIENPFNANATIDVRHPRDTIHSTRGLSDESLSTATNNYQSSPTINERVGNNETSRSAQKCSEYHDAVEGLTRVISLTGTSRALPMRNFTIGKCTNIRHLVVGGRAARRESLPHVVALGRENPENKKFVLHCGGSLIAPSWVLTAAHCTHGVGGGVAIARLGIQRLSDNNGQTIALRRSIRHPSYSPPAKYADIALLELERPVTFGPSIKPACLHQHYHNIPTFAWVCGWGATEFGGTESNTLQEAKLEFVNNVECAIKHNRSISVPEGVVPSMVCAGAPHNNWEQDACQGDSGGPLQIVHPTYTCLHQIIGITSFGSGCAFVDSPGVYTRVSYYLDWIENVVWPLGS